MRFTFVDANVNLMLYSLKRGSLKLALLGEEIAPLFGLLSNRLSVFRNICISNLHNMLSRIYSSWIVH